MNWFLPLLTFLSCLLLTEGHYTQQNDSKEKNWQVKSNTRHFQPAEPRLGSSVRNLNQAEKIQAENWILDKMYEKSVAEGGRVIVYAGGDTPGQQDYYKSLFEDRFPNMTLDIIVDYSKFHNGRIDNQLATNSLVPDLTQLQTLQDFPRWKAQGVLMQYRPFEWDKIFNEFKDPDGYYTGIYIYAFTNLINRKLLPHNETWPTEAQDYLRPEFKRKIVLTYPNDDDAILFWFKQIVDKYGWSYVQKLRAQEPIFVRGTQGPFDAVEAGASLVSPSVAGSPVNNPDCNTVFLLPKKDPFMTWPQTAAIFRDAQHPEGAKLYLSWILSYQFQTQFWDLWSVRRDGNNPRNLRGIFEYPGQTDVLAFGKWMQDRGQVERFRGQLTNYLGEVKGDPSPGFLGSHPDKAIPH